MAKKKIKKVLVNVRGKFFSDHHYEGMCFGGLIGFAVGVVCAWGVSIIQGVIR